MHQIIIISLHKDKEFTSICPNSSMGLGAIQLSPYLSVKCEFGQNFHVTGKFGQTQTGYLFHYRMTSCISGPGNVLSLLRLGEDVSDNTFNSMIGVTPPGLHLAHCQL
jgi:hypothetical protein